MSMKIKHQQSGFTIVELMVATVVFSIVLIVILASFLQVGRMFYKGISFANTNESARSVTESIAVDIRFSQSFTNCDPSICNYPSRPNTRTFCVGSHRYTYTLYEKVTTANMNNGYSGVQRTDINGVCSPSPAAGGTATVQLLGPDMQLNRFDLSGCTGEMCRVAIHIIFYGADSNVFGSFSQPGTPLQAPDAYCSGNSLDTQFCATATLNTTIATRY